MFPEREKRIRNWIIATVSNGGIGRNDDLHVDVIDQQWRERATWLSAAIVAYKSAIAIRDELALPVKVALGFSLTDAGHGAAEPFESEAQFEQELDWSPPSLYLFNVGDHQHLSATVRENPLPKSFSSQLPVGTKSYLLQWDAGDGSRRRSVFVERLED
jgi:hypothetical protein